MSAKIRVTSSTNAISSCPGELYSVVVEGSGSAGTVTLYDSLTQTGTIIGEWPIPASSTVDISFKALPITTGLSVTISSVQGVQIEYY